MAKVGALDPIVAQGTPDTMFMPLTGNNVSLPHPELVDELGNREGVVQYLYRVSAQCHGDPDSLASVNMANMADNQWPYSADRFYNPHVYGVAEGKYPLDAGSAWADMLAKLKDAKPVISPADPAPGSWEEVYERIRAGKVGPVQPPIQGPILIPGPGQPPILIAPPGMSRVLMMAVDWANPVRIYSSDYGHFGANDILCIALTVGNRPNPPSSIPKLGVTFFQGPQIKRDAVLSPVAGDFSEQPSRYANLSGVDSPTALFCVGDGANPDGLPRIPYGATWYFNIRNPGADVTGGPYDVAVDLAKQSGY